MYHDDLVGIRFENSSIGIRVTSQEDFDLLVSHLRQNMENLLQDSPEGNLSSTPMIKRFVDSLRETELELDLSDTPLEP